MNGQEKKEDKGQEAEDEVDEDGEIVPKKPGGARASIQKTSDVLPIPRESAEDLMPFPMNRQFRSQHVLSEELKDVIYKRVMVDGETVRNVSADLGVEMNRVGAVVRLKAVEKEWEKQVCRLDEDAFLSWEKFPNFYDEKDPTRLVFKTFTVVTK